MSKNKQIIIYRNGEIALKVSVDKNTIWLTQKDLVKLFEKDQSVISRHIRNIFKDKEVNEKSNMQKMHIANSDKPVTFYSLDIVLAVGYRTNSSKAIQFRKWATKILKQYIYDGYVINAEKITYQRFNELENDVNLLKQKMKLLEQQTLEPKQGIFYDGQIFDAHKFVSDLIRKANKNIILIDNYIDDSVLTLFSKRKKGVLVTIYTKKITKQLQLDLKKFNSQYDPIQIKVFNKSHDRFLIIDEKEIYHIGASLKDLGKKWFAFSKLDIDNINILSRLKK